MTKTVEGFYQDGYIQISELPQGVSEQTCDLNWSVEAV
ncbi:hypothetical protein Dacsa_3372 [Dactylococcopsis salina PCC 8305]|uniref:Uncharacterized protein n=1 Tax=Dactylococcopsis salina (strain PCC 8305) TaxID=13035 RepID=K9Z0G8_DACS8|nr:hypothetical protein Dacsa_3372 [Dactylococcopsis salina PCC 8305]